MTTKKSQDPLQGRRSFLRQSACASLGITGVVNTLANLRLMNAALAAGGPVSDYKALVCVFLQGGNDGNNTLVPMNGNPHRRDYESNRGILTLPNSDLHPLAGGEGFGVHPSLGPVADLYNAGDLSFVQNVGTLAYPTTRQQYLNRTVPLPPQLFSHSDQQVQWQSSIADKPFSSGWGGRTADLLNDSYNVPGSQVSMSISLAGVNSYQVGTAGDVLQYSISSGGALSLRGYGRNYTDAVKADGSYRDSDRGRRLKAFDSIVGYSHEHLFEEGYNKVVRSALAGEAVIDQAIAEGNGQGVDIPAMIPADGPGSQLRTVARLIAGRNCLGNRRQIFFVQVAGYDTHADQLGAHAYLLDGLGASLKGFSETMKALGLDDNVVTFTCSDFTRTLTPNGSDPQVSGSDHGWGGHQMVMGGPVRGGRLFGAFPELKVGQGSDTDNERGRWIPTTSVDQYSAVLARWMGIGSTELEAIFPNLSRFDDPFSVQGANMDFLDLSV